MVLRILNKSDFPKMDSKISIQPAKLISEQTYIAPKSLLVTELFFQVPLDYSQPDSRTITLFAHRVTQHCTSKEDSAEPKRYLVYLEGGPGFGNAPPPRITHSRPLRLRRATSCFSSTIAEPA